MYLWNYENSLNHGGYIISFEDFLFSLKALAPWIFITSVIFFYILWTKAVNREHKLNQQLLTFKYQTLKSQVNPHFLFNSLNVLTTLIHSDPLKAEQFTTKLSDIYRYILVNENNKLVLLSDELQFVRDYFDLQKVRDEDKIQLSIKIENENQYFIPPVSLQVLVENALKHNAASGQKPLVISVIQDGGFIKVVNNVQRKTNLQHSSGMGLENLKERIRLLTNQEVEIVETNNEFAVTIPLIDN